MLRLLRNRDFALLVGGQAISELGDGIFFVALAWRVYQTYSNPAALSVVGIAFFVPRLVLTIAGGVVSDRFERRWTMIAADGIRAVSVALLALVSLGAQQELAWLAALVALQGAGGSLFGPSETALLPQLVSADEIGKANSLRTIVSPVSYAILGPALGGLITAAWGPQAAFGIDAATYVVSVATLLLMTARPVMQAGERRSVLSDAREGFAYVAGRPWLWGPIATAAVAQFLYAGPNQALVPYLVKFELHASAGALGVVLACGGLGTAAAGLLIGRLPRPRALVTFMLVGWAQVPGAGHRVSPQPEPGGQIREGPAGSAGASASGVEMGGCWTRRGLDPCVFSWGCTARLNECTARILRLNWHRAQESAGGFLGRDLRLRGDAADPQPGR